MLLALLVTRWVFPLLLLDQKRSHILGVRVSSETRRLILEICDLEDKTVSSLINDLLIEYISKFDFMR